MPPESIGTTENSTVIKDSLVKKITERISATALGIVDRPLILYSLAVILALNVPSCATNAEGSEHLEKITVVAPEADNRTVVERMEGPPEVLPPPMPQVE